MNHLQPKPTCSTCPFFRRVAGAALNDPGECLHDRATPFPMPNPRGGLQVIGLRSQTTHDATCSSHPRMKQWLWKHYGTTMADDECHVLSDRESCDSFPEDRPTMPEHHAAQDAPDEREREDEHASERERELAEASAREETRETGARGNGPSKLILPIR